MFHKPAHKDTLHRAAQIEWKEEVYFHAEAERQHQDWVNSLLQLDQSYDWSHDGTIEF